MKIKIGKSKNLPAFEPGHLEREPNVLAASSVSHVMNVTQDMYTMYSKKIIP